ncbi:alpha/beta hydrolase [soil metagenome]
MPSAHATRRPYVDVRDPAGPVRAVALVLHGGRANGTGVPNNLSLARLRMRPFQKTIARAGRRHGVAAWMLHYRVRGWNGAAADPVRDVTWALAEARRRHGDSPVVLVGHSMGARAGLRAAGDPSVVAICALAPWLPEGEPVDQLAGRTLVIAHGDRERWTDPEGSYRYAVRAKAVTPEVARFDVVGDAHGMLRRAADWHALARNVTLGALGIEPFAPAVTNALHQEGTRGLRVPLPSSR